MIDGDLACADVFAESREVLVDLLDDRLGRIARKDAVEDVSARGARSVPTSQHSQTRGNSLRSALGQLGVLSPLHVESLDLEMDRTVVLDLASGVLLLVEEQHALKDGVRVNLELLVLVVDRLFEIVADLERLFEVGLIRVDEDGIGISVDDLQGDAR